MVVEGQLIQNPIESRRELPSPSDALIKDFVKEQWPDVNETTARTLNEMVKDLLASKGIIPQGYDTSRNVYLKFKEEARIAIEENLISYINSRLDSYSRQVETQGAHSKLGEFYREQISKLKQVAIALKLDINRDITAEPDESPDAIKIAS
jgi:hypothetical protein